MLEKPKMFNRAIVFGSVLKKPVLKKTKYKKIYASIQLQCPNDLHGDVRVWGKIWGDAGKDALDQIKQGDVIRLEGSFQQYESERSGRITNFNFFSYRYCVGRETTDLRAVFILVGDVLSVSPLPEGLELTLQYQQGEGGDTPQSPEVYRLFVSKRDTLADVVDADLIGNRVKVKGLLENEVDDFCETTPTKPALKEIETLWVPQQKNSDQTGAPETESAEVPF